MPVPENPKIYNKRHGNGVFHDRAFCYLHISELKRWDSEIVFKFSIDFRQYLCQMREFLHVMYQQQLSAYQLIDGAIAHARHTRHARTRAGTLAVFRRRTARRHTAGRGHHPKAGAKLAAVLCRADKVYH